MPAPKDSKDPKDLVATIALLNLIQLLSAELVAGEHRDDVERLIRAIDRKIDATPLPRGIDVNDARDGLAQVKALLRPVVKRVRAQAEAIKITDRATTARPKTFRYLQ
jgi:hypothetical protein